MDNDKWTKPSYQTNGSLGDSTDPSTWTTFDRAVATLDRFDGIVLALTGDDDLVGVDLDHCIPAGVIEDWAVGVIDTLDSYTEMSPSGTGLRVIVRGKLPPKGRKRGNVEMYENGRISPVTGSTIEDRTSIMYRQAEAEAVHQKWIAPPKKEPSSASTATGPTPTMSDLKVNERARDASNGDPAPGGLQRFQRRPQRRRLRCGSGAGVDVGVLDSGCRPARSPVPWFASDA